MSDWTHNYIHNTLTVVHVHAGPNLLVVIMSLVIDNYATLYNSA